MNNNRTVKQISDCTVVVMIRYGTGGWRAEIGKDFYIGNIRLFAQALANCIINEGKAAKPAPFETHSRRF